MEQICFYSNGSSCRTSAHVSPAEVYFPPPRNHCASLETRTRPGAMTECQWRLASRESWDFWGFWGENGANTICLRSDFTGDCFLHVEIGQETWGNIAALRKMKQSNVESLLCHRRWQLELTCAGTTWRRDDADKSVFGKRCQRRKDDAVWEGGMWRFEFTRRPAHILPELCERVNKAGRSFLKDNNNNNNKTKTG